MKEVLKTDNAPAAIGPYSQGIKVGNTIYTSGQLPIDMKTGILIEDDIKKATAASLENVSAILKAGGATLKDVVKVVVFIKDMKDFADMNEIYGHYFTENEPARSCVQPAKLPKDALIEIEAIAVI